MTTPGRAGALRKAHFTRARLHRLLSWVGAISLRVFWAPTLRFSFALPRSYAAGPQGVSYLGYEHEPANPVHKKHNAPRKMTTPPAVLVRLDRGYAGCFVKGVTIKDTNLRKRGTPMRLEQRELEMAEVRSDLSAADLWDAENYFREQGVAEFIYDEPIDVYRFPEDGRLAFCDAFADWERLQERGYLHF